MKNTYRAYSIQVLGYYVENPSPTTAEYIATMSIQRIANKSQSEADVFLKWNAGEGATKCRKSINSRGTSYDSCSYVQKAMNYYNKLK